MNDYTINYTTETGDECEIAVVYIGKKSMGIDGNDHYFDFDFGREDIDEVEIDDWFHQNYHSECTTPGGAFCTDYTIQRGKYDNSCCTVIVHYRYDV